MVRGGARPKRSAAIAYGRAKGKGPSVGKSVKSDARQERLAAALRENLKRRKLRARALAEDELEGPVETGASAPDPLPGSPNKRADQR